MPYRVLKLSSLFLLATCLPVGTCPGQVNVADLVQRVSPSVVYLETPRGHGSGFVIAVGEHIDILTSYHVLDGGHQCTVCFFLPRPGRDVPEKIEIDKARLVESFPRLDFAVVRLPADNPRVARLRKVIKPLPRGDSRTVRVGERVILIGSPTAGMSVLGNSVGDGLISGRNRHIKGVPYFQTTAPVNPGNSGGPLLNLKGEVIGLVTHRNRSADNIGFALPVHLTEPEHYRFYLPEDLDDKLKADLDEVRRLVERKKFDPALQMLTKLNEAHPEKVKPLVLAAELMSRRHNPEMALVFYEKALSMKGIRYDDLIGCVLEIGNIHGVAGHHDKALAAFKRGLERDPTHALLNRNVGIAYSHLGNPAKALAHWTVSLNSDPDQPWLRQRFRELTKNGTH